MSLLDDVARQKRDEEQKRQAEAAARADRERKFQTDCLAVLQRLKELQCEALLTEVRDKIWQCGEVVTFLPASTQDFSPPYVLPSYQPGTIRAAYLLRATWPAAFVATHSVRTGVPNIEGDCHTEFVPDTIRHDSTELSVAGVVAARAHMPGRNLTELVIKVGKVGEGSIVVDRGDVEAARGAVREAVVTHLAALREPEVYRLRDRAEQGLVRELAAQVQSGYLKLDSELIAQYPDLREKVSAELATLPPPSPPAPPPKRTPFGRR